MANLSEAASKLLLDWILTGAAAPRPSATWVGLSLDPPNSRFASELPPGQRIFAADRHLRRGELAGGLDVECQRAEVRPAELLDRDDPGVANLGRGERRRDALAGPVRDRAHRGDPRRGQPPALRAVRRSVVTAHVVFALRSRAERSRARRERVKFLNDFDERLYN
jgi:hypothetical protein